MIRKHKVRLLYMIDDLRFGGRSARLSNLLRTLIETGLIPFYLFITHLVNLLQSLKPMGYPFLYIPKKYKYSLWYLVRLVASIRRTNPDIIHSFLQTPSFWARVGGMLGRSPVIIISIRNSKFRQCGRQRIWNSYCEL